MSNRWDMDTRVCRAICPHDCPDTCALLVHIEDGMLTKVEGDPHHPITRGFVCAKVRQYPRRVYAKDRLLYPMKRTGTKGEGRFTRIGWDEALATIADRFREVIQQEGAEAILPCYGSGTTGLIQMYCGGPRLFDRLGASIFERTICSEAGKAGWRYTVGTSYGADPEACTSSRLIILWGTNPYATNVHFLPILKQAKRGGATVVLIDPHRTRSATLADRFYQINPGTDGLLALAMMRTIIEEGRYDRHYVERHTVGFERLKARVMEYSVAEAARITGLSAEEIRGLARLYAETRPAFIRIGIGLQHHTNGGMTVRTIACLPALVGAWGVKGGGATYNNAGVFPVNKETLLGETLQHQDRRRVNINQLGLALTTLSPPISALYIYNSNPVLSLPDQNRIVAGLKREDLFTVVHEQMMTDTARYANIVLPATVQFEHFDIHISYWHYYIAVNRPALPPRGECKSNYEVFQLLAERVGIEDDGLRETPEEIAERMLKIPHPYLQGIDGRALVQKGGFARLNTRQVPFVPFQDGRFGTPTGKVEFCSQRMEAEGLDPLPRYVPPVESRDGAPELWRRYPLHLLTPSSEHFLNSNFANLPAMVAKEGGQPWLKIHAADAAARGVRSGDLVRIWNERGSCLLYAEVGEDVPPGTVLSTTMWWQAHSPGGTSPGATTCGRLADMGRGSTFHTNLVEIERVGRRL